MAFRVGATLDGFREFRRLVGRLEPDVKERVRSANVAIASHVGNRVKQAANARPGVRKRTGGVAASVKVVRSFREPAIRVLGHRTKGSSDVAVQEFGGRAPLFGNRERWFTVRPKEKGGYFLFPTVKAEREFINREYLKALDDALRGSGS